MPDETLPPVPPEAPPPAPPESPRQQVAIEDEMRKSYLDYSMSVIIGRALPDVRDGLKPVHRRILYAMHTEGLQHNKRYSKCAGVVGEVLKKYHPHGDAAVYDALVRMAQDLNLRYPLIDGQGNFGSVDGDPAAAYRYTEARLTSSPTEMLADIDKETVDFVPNFDDSTVEPMVLPARFPNLLVNGSSGIAVGMATNIPPHNLGEVIDAAIHLHRQPRGSTVAELMQLIPGPGFPDRRHHPGARGHPPAPTRPAAAASSARRGPNRGAPEDRARDHRRHRDPLPGEQGASSSSTSPSWCARSGSRASRDLRDESDREGMRVVIELKRDAIAAGGPEQPLHAHRSSRPASA